jgi:hypothetical protein
MERRIWGYHPGFYNTEGFFSDYPLSRKKKNSFLFPGSLLYVIKQEKVAPCTSLVIYNTRIKSSALRLYAHAQGIKKWANIL